MVTLREEIPCESGSGCLGYPRITGNVYVVENQLIVVKGQPPDVAVGLSDFLSTYLVTLHSRYQARYIVGYRLAMTNIFSMPIPIDPVYSPIDT
jgi:hypothetical protein